VKAQHIFFLLLFSSLLLNSKCRKENEPQLPPETTIGANTFGCKIDGKIFMPKGNNGMPGISAEYPYLGTGIGGGWFLGVSGNNLQSNPITGITINTDSLLLEEGRSYLMKEKKGYPYAIYQNGLNLYYIRSDDTGEITITKHNQSSRILSGRFSFTATSIYDQNKARVTEGRFDIRY
jgi:hypothetical protein